MVIDVSAPGAVDTLKDKPFTIKEGAHFRIKVVFQVHHEVLSGLKYLQVVKRKGVRVSKDEEMLGSYAPNTTDKPVYEKKCKFPLPLVQSAVVICALITLLLFSPRGRGPLGIYSSWPLQRGLEIRG